MSHYIIFFKWPVLNLWMVELKKNWSYTIFPFPISRTYFQIWFDPSLNQSSVANLQSTTKVISLFQVSRMCGYRCRWFAKLRKLLFLLYYMALHRRSYTSRRSLVFHRSQILCFSNDNIGIVCDALQPTIVYSVHVFSNTTNQSRKEKLQLILYCEVFFYQH